jgi:hypothetical protein
VANAARDNEELAGTEEDIAAIGWSAANAQSAAKDEKHLVFAIMSVPGELSLNTRNFDKLIVNATDDSWRPKLYTRALEIAASGIEGDRMLLHRQGLSNAI